MNEYDVWTEGFAATGEHDTAMCHSVTGADYMKGNLGIPYKVLANSFIEACEKVLGSLLDRNKDDTLILSQSKVITQDGEINVPMVWACRCFDNEQEARKSFG